MSKQILLKIILFLFAMNITKGFCGDEKIKEMMEEIENRINKFEEIKRNYYEGMIFHRKNELLVKKIILAIKICEEMSDIFLDIFVQLTEVKSYDAAKKVLKEYNDRIKESLERFKKINNTLREDSVYKKWKEQKEAREKLEFEKELKEWTLLEGN